MTPGFCWLLKMSRVCVLQIKVSRLLSTVGFQLLSFKLKGQQAAVRWLHWWIKSRFRIRVPVSGGFISSCWGKWVRNPFITPCLLDYQITKISGRRRALRAPECTLPRRPTSPEAARLNEVARVDSNCSSSSPQRTLSRRRRQQSRSDTVRNPPCSRDQYVTSSSHTMRKPTKSLNLDTTSKHTLVYCAGSL